MAGWRHTCEQAHEKSLYAEEMSDTQEISASDPSLAVAAASLKKLTGVQLRRISGGNQLSALARRKERLRTIKRSTMPWSDDLRQEEGIKSSQEAFL